MTVRISKPEFNLREKLSELDKPVGLKGSELLKSETAQDARTLVSAGRKNIIINGDFRIAQKGTTHNSSGYRTVDRFKMSAGGANNTLTQSQHALSSSDAPYSHGFRYSYHLNNAGQNANSQGYVIFQYNIEAQDMAQSGWNYTSDKDHITISFWVKSSITHTFLFTLYTSDGTPQDYNVLFPVQADTWKKIIVTVPGDPDITFDNNNDYGLQIMFNPYLGSHYTSGSTVNRWRDHAGYTSRPDMDDKWWKTASTFEITGVQLELGQNATEFEHRPRGEELLLCQRYLYSIYRRGSSNDGNLSIGGVGSLYTNSAVYIDILLPTEMRATPSLIVPSGTNRFQVCPTTCITFGNPTMIHAHTNCITLTSNITSSNTAGRVGNVFMATAAWSEGEQLAFSAEFS